MVKSRKISFLIPAHNEEKIIGKTLDNLFNLPYNNYEVIIGLDGCTDNTEQIVRKFRKKSNRFGYYKFDLRKGKPAVIDKIIKKAKGEIIIINDADWIFKVGSKERMKQFLSVFDEKKIGGIADSFTIEWSEKARRSRSIGFLGEMWADKFWLDYQKENFTYIRNDLLYIDKKKLEFPFLVNVFRKKLYQKNYTLADDFERCFDILEKGYEIVLFQDKEMPRFTTVYNKIRIKDLIKTKIRTALARNQLEKRYEYKISKSLYIKILFYFIKNIYKIKRMRERMGVFLWFFAMFLGEMTRMVKNKKIKDTREGWLIRSKR